MSGAPEAVPRTALVVDDEPDLRALVAMTLERLGIDTHTAANLAEARNVLTEYDVDVCLTDMRLPDGNGVAFVAELAESHPGLPVAVITAHGHMEAAVEAMKAGAFDFVSKPVDLKGLRRLVTQATASRGNAPAVDERRTPSPGTPPGPERRGAEGAVGDRLTDGHLLIGASAPMVELRATIAKVARTNAPIWITGESGTGKELIARLIHRNGPRADGPFVAVNCGAIPGELMESEFFGHRRGAFTGAHSDEPGLFRSAEGGTLFLDEIAELPMHMQVKLLRAIQERSVRPVGDAREQPVDVRILSASHVDLAHGVTAGAFRQDLYYRLNVITVRAPSLRSRPGDIDAIAASLLERLDGGEAPAPCVSLTEGALAALRAHRFPGNVRELENVLERATALCTDGCITAEDLSLDAPDPGAGGRESPSLPEGASDPVFDCDDAIERRRILTALERVRWNRKKAAVELGMTYRQLRYRIERMDLEDGEDRAA